MSKYNLFWGFFPLLFWPFCLSKCKYYNISLTNILISFYYWYSNPSITFFKSLLTLFEHFHFHIHFRISLCHQHELYFHWNYIEHISNNSISFILKINSFWNCFVRCPLLTNAISFTLSISSGFSLVNFCWPLWSYLILPTVFS